MPTASEPELLTQSRHCGWHASLHEPEQVRGEELDATDGFVFLRCGALRDDDGAYEPFSGRYGGVIREAILNRTPVPPVRVNPELPPKLEEIINKALEKDRKLRYQNAAEIRTDLQRLKRDTDSGRAGFLSQQRQHAATAVGGSE